MLAFGGVGLNTVCTHCHKWFEVSDKALGKNARCRSCGKVFVITPAPVADEDSAMVDVHQPGGSTARLSAVRGDEVADLEHDPLAALADAAEQSGYEKVSAVTEHAREHGSFVSRRARGEVRGTASGAVASVVCGSIGVFLAVVLLVLAILAATKVMPLNAGIIAGLFFGSLVTAVVCLVAVVQGGGARRRIRRAKGTLQGVGQANAGIAMGWIGLAIVLAAGITLIIIISKSGGIVLEKRIVPN